MGLSATTCVGWRPVERDTVIRNAKVFMLAPRLVIIRTSRIFFVQLKSSKFHSGIARTADRLSNCHQCVRCQLGTGAKRLTYFDNVFLDGFFLTHCPTLTAVTAHVLHQERSIGDFPVLVFHPEGKGRQDAEPLSFHYEKGSVGLPLLIMISHIIFPPWD